MFLSQGAHWEEPLRAYELGSQGRQWLDFSLLYVPISQSVHSEVKATPEMGRHYQYRNILGNKIIRTIKYVGTSLFTV